MAEMRDFFLVEFLEWSVIFEGVVGFGNDLALGIDRGLPAQLLASVPLLALRFLVEIAQTGRYAAVIPRVGGVEGGQDRFELGVDAVDWLCGAGRCHRHRSSPCAGHARRAQVESGCTVDPAAAAVNGESGQ